MWERLLDILIDEPDFEWLMIDASYIKIHQDGTGAIGGNQDMSLTKGGSPLFLILYAGRVKMKIRFVEEDDCEKLLSIYAQYINTSITFECDLPSTIEFSAKINKISNKYPWLVIENDKDILGYAYAHEHDERQAYQWNAELTIYLDKAESGKKFGRRLYFLLENILRTQGIISLYARITIPNPASFGLHEAMGFKLNHILRKGGFKAGKWHDVACLVKDIAPHSEKPLPVIPFSELDAKILAKIMSTY